MVNVIRSRAQALFGGVALAGVIAAAATFLSEHYGAPAMLFALLIGMAFHFLAENEAVAEGVEFSARTLLRLGVGLLGLRLSFDQVALLGTWPIVAVVIFTMATLGCGAVLARLFGRQLAFGLLAGGAVAICGASAALAIAAVLPAREGREKDVLFTVIAVTTLSTVAMIAYPILFAALGLDEVQSGFLIGATIHDVAQVVGAGYSIGEEAGLVATFVKMLRVGLLPVVLLAVMLSMRGARSQRLGLPWFLVLFVVLAAAANLGLVPQGVQAPLGAAARWMLVIAISALGIKTSLAAMAGLGGRHVAIVVLETLFLLGIALAFVLAGGL